MKRTLVIANACFSDSISNGRTLARLFEGSEKEKLAQFFVYGQPDFKVCSNLYRVTDRDAMYSLFSRKTCGGIVDLSDTERGKETEAVITPKRKTPFKMLIREIVWMLGSWKRGYLWKWLDDFKPERICLFVANNIFLIRLAVSIAKKYRIPIVVYTTEGYCFMNFNYLTNRFSLFYSIYYNWLYGTYKKLSQYVTQGFFNSTLLRDRYEEIFHYPCSCVMNTSKINYFDNYAVKSEKPVKVSYLGNLGLNRHKALIEIGDALQEINKSYYLEVYGTLLNQEMADEFQRCKGVRYCGFIPYDEVVKTIHSSTLLVHVEWNDARMNRDLKYAFSTKIADYVCSGTPMLLYASEELAETVFLKENDCAFIVHEREKLKEVLERALADEEERKRIIEKARGTKEQFLLGNNKFIQAFM